MDAHAGYFAASPVDRRPDLHRVGRRTLDVARAGADTGTAPWRAPSRRRPRIDPGTDSVRLLVGRSTIVDVGTPIARVSLTSADVADALVTSPNQLLVNGKTPGTISMFVWDRAGAVRRLRSRRAARPGAAVRTAQAALPERDDRGREQRQERRAVRHRLQQGHHREDGERRGRLRRQQGGARHAAPARTGGPSNQVLLRVRFAEVSRSAMTELGLGISRVRPASRTPSAASRPSSFQRSVRGALGHQGRARTSAADVVARQAS